MTNDEAQAFGAKCGICPLKGNTIVPAKPLDPKRIRLAIVGESPGRNEEKLGEPFVGMSGQLLNATLARSGFAREDAYVTNAALCRSDLDKENDRAAECCAPRLLRELREAVPASVPLLLAGKSAARSVLGVRALLNARGFIWTLAPIGPRLPAAVKKAAKTRKGEDALKAETFAGRDALAGRLAIPTLHPSFILRADTWAPVFRIDVARAVRLARGEVAFPLEDSGKHRVGGLGILKDFGSRVTLDIETSGIDWHEVNILCVGLTDIVSGATAVIWPWKRSYVTPLAKWLGNRKQVVGHNIIGYDLLVLRKQGLVW